MILTIDFEKKEVYLHDKCSLYKLISTLDRIFGDNNFSQITIINNKKDDSNYTFSNTTLNIKE